MKSNTPDLLKFKRLQRRLGASVPTVCGLLELLWISTSKNAPQGDIGRFTNEEIAIGCFWDGDPDLLVNSLLECGWLDASEEHRLVVHDWAEHCPSWVKGNLASQKKEFVQPAKQGAKGGAKPPAIGAPAEGGAPSGAPPSQVKSSQVKPSESGEPLSPPHTPAKSELDLEKPISKSRHGNDPAFVEVWEMWKRKLAVKNGKLDEWTEKLQLKSLEQFSTEEAIAMVEFSASRTVCNNLITNGDHRKTSSPAKQSKPKERDPCEVPIMSQPGEAERYAEFVRKQEAQKALRAANG